MCILCGIFRNLRGYLQDCKNIANICSTLDGSCPIKSWPNICSTLDSNLWNIIYKIYGLPWNMSNIMCPKYLTVPWILSYRFRLAVMCFLGLASLHNQRINMSVAVVCMVNQTALSIGQGQLEVNLNSTRNGTFSHARSSAHYIPQENEVPGYEYVDSVNNPVCSLFQFSYILK